VIGCRSGGDCLSDAAGFDDRGGRLDPTLRVRLAAFGRSSMLGVGTPKTVIVPVFGASDLA